ncbi:unnamed protein product [Acanthoscelides obtectus]|uniref:Uncharacterized protein n=1 Tax=Acanthoscelides obtectus TaxID=200917 RepID=A0A9P0PCZ1_ACAOB|nr:unnamed protein product [Acanthoscelides obtectus]CAK1635893.1 hypothetical protein AOBTE_LOCUS9600 [Acanthoscelides obtectus]
MKIQKEKRTIAEFLV